MSITKIAKGGICIAAALMISGCVSLLPEASSAPSIYRLSMPPAAVDANANAPVIRVATPAASRALSGADIVVSPDGTRLAFAQGAEWAETIPRLLQNAALSAMAQNPNIRTVTPPTVARANYALELHVRNFEGNFDRGENSAPIVIVRITATLTDLTNRSVVGNKEFMANVRASERRVSSIVAAQDDAARQVMDALSLWVDSMTTPETASAM